MKKRFHVLSRMFTKMNVFLFLLFALLMVPSAWAATYYENVTTNGQIVKPYCTDDKVIQVNSGVTSFVVATENGAYNNNCIGNVYLNVPSGNSLSLSGEVALPYNSNLIIYDSDGSSLYSVSNYAASRYHYNITTLYSSGNSALLYFSNDGDYNYNNNFTLNVSVLPPHSVRVSVPWKQDSPWSYYVVFGGDAWYGYYKETKSFVTGTTISMGKLPGLTWTLWGVNVRDANGNIVLTTQKGDSLQFTMPASDVTVVPTFSNCSDSYRGCGYNLVNESRTVKIGANSSIKVYDDGGIDYPYANNFNGYLTIKAPMGYRVKVSGTVATEKGGFDYLMLYEGEKGASSSPICKVYSADSNVAVAVPANCKSVDSVLTLWFHSDGGIFANGLNLVVSSEPMTYNVSLNNNQISYGSISVDKTSAKTDETVTVTATPQSGYILKSVSVINTATDASVVTSGGWETNNKVTFTMPAGDVKVTPNFVRNTYSITYNKTKGGELQGNVSASVGSAVEVYAKNSKDSLLKDVQITDVNGNTVKVEKFSLSKFRFIMPIGDVTVIPTWTDNFSADGGLYINMPKTGTVSATIPEGVKSFKVYDDGGKSGNYSNNASGTLYLTAPEGYILLLTGNVNTYNTSDYLQIYNGPSTSNADSLLGTKSNSSTCKYYSMARRMTLKFVSDGSNNSSGLDLTVTLVKLNLDLSNDGTNYFVNMIYQHKATINIPANVSSFKVYDEGGKSGSYSNNNRDTLVLIAPQNHVLKLTGSVTTAYSGDTLEVYSGSTINSNNLLGKKRSTSSGSSLNIGKMVSSGQYMTLYFESDGSTNYAGLDLNVKVVDEENSITIVNAEGGMVTLTGGITSAKVGSEVQLNVTSNLSAGYLLSGIDVVDGDGDMVKLSSGGNFANPSATFIMPASPVSVSPHFTKDWNVAGDLYINMPTNENRVISIPSGVQSFKVYDDGGKNGNYSNDYEHSLRLTPPSGYVLQLEGSIKTNDDNDYLTVKDYADGRTLLDKGRSVSGKLYAASMLLTFHSDASGNNSGLDLTVTVIPKKNVTVVDDVTGGTIQANKNMATPGSAVTLTATMESGYYLQSVNITKSNGDKVNYDLDYPWYSNTSSATITFNMPTSDVTVTPVFTKNLTAAYAMSVNIPSSGTRSLTVPVGVKSFKIYNEGDENGNYSNNSNGSLVLTAPTGYIFELTGFIETYIISQNLVYGDCETWGEFQGQMACVARKREYVNICDKEDNLSVYDGSSVSATPLINGMYGCVNIGGSTDCTLDYMGEYKCGSLSNRTRISVEKNISSSNKMTLNFKSGASGTAAGLNLTVTLRKLNMDDLEDDGNGGKSVDMVLSKKVSIDIPSDVESFKIYDDGGKNGDYNNNNADTLVLNAPAGKTIELTGTIKTNVVKTYESSSCLQESTFDGWPYCYKTDNWYTNTCDIEDNLNIYDGSSVSATSLLQGKYGCLTSIGSHWSCIYYSPTATSRCDSHSSAPSIPWVSVGTLRSSGNTMTLVFKSNSSGSSEGLDLTARVIPIDYAIQVNGATNGKVLAKTTAHAGDVVSLTSVPTTSGYMLKDVVVKDASGNTVKVSQYSFSVSEFIMPAKNVEVTPTFTNNLTAEGGLHLDMRKNVDFDPSFTKSVQSFKIYDNGGKSGAYEANSDDILRLAAPSGYRIKLTGYVTLEKGADSLYVFDGSSLETKLYGGTSSSNNVKTSIGEISSSDNHLTLRFKSNASKQYAGLDLTVTLIPTYTVAVETVVGGSVSSDKASASKDETVTLTASAKEGYLFDGVSVEDADGNVVALSKDIHWYSGVSENVVTFSMPTNAVTVTPKFSSIDDLYVNMPTRGGIDVNIPENVTSFKIYDDGGKDGNYTSGQGQIFVIYDKNSGNAGLKLSGNVSVPKNGVNLLGIYALTDDFEYAEFYAYNGSSDGHAEDIGTFINSSSLLFEFRTGDVGDGAGLDLRVDVVKSPGGGVEVVYDDAHVIGNGNLKRWATIKDGDKTSKVNIPEDVDVESVDMTRTFTPDVYSTMVLPFSVRTEKVEGLNAVLRYNGIKTVNGVSSIRMKVVWAAECVIKDDKGNCVSYKDTVLNANTPYMVQMGQGKLVVNGGVTLKKTAPADTSIDGWIFRGTWQYKKWGASGVDPETGYAYGFAASAVEESNIKVGEFVRAGEGAWISPMRAYLVRADKAPVQGVRANGNYVMRPSFAQEELPELLSVVIDHGDGDEEHTTVIGHFNTRTGEFKMNNDAAKRTFDVKGRNVGDKASKARGAYYGKKVIAK